MVHYGRVVSTFSTAALIAISLANTAAADTADKGFSATQGVKRVSVRNFGKVNENYYRGAQPEGRDYADLAAFGVKTVIDLTEGGDSAEPGIVKRTGMNFYRIPMNTHRVPTPAQQAQFLKIVNDPASQPVYVHCQGGRHRTGVMTAIFRMTEQGWTPNQAFSEMKRYGYGADFMHPEFKRFVYDFKATPNQAPESVVAVSIPGLK